MGREKKKRKLKTEWRVTMTTPIKGRRKRRAMSGKASSAIPQRYNYGFGRAAPGRGEEKDQYLLLQPLLRPKCWPNLVPAMYVSGVIYNAALLCRSHYLPLCFL